jgi:two-component system response regulator AtoC
MRNKVRILVVDDEQGMLEVCADTLQALTATEVVLERCSHAAADRLKREPFDLLITDIRMPELGGVELLRLARQNDPNLPALMLTAHPTVETAVESMKLGAADYIIKPFLPEDLLGTVERLLETKCLREENHLLRRQLERPYEFGEMIGESPAMQEVFATIKRVAATNFDVLIIGETGTGKEMVARALHQHSHRKSGPFVPVDCGAIPEELMEREFFGHERGAFTGAQTRGLGLLEFANQGTFFLDELTQLPPRLQAKLLRVLQERRVRRVGGTREIALDFRIIAASSSDLEEQVRKGTFRSDLFHRINVTRVALPPLRERIGDLFSLARTFLGRYVSEMERDPVELSPEALEILTAYSWPGNVRELQNLLKRTLTMTTGPLIGVDDLPEEIVARADKSTAKTGKGFFAQREGRLNTFEKEYLKNLLTNCHGDVSCATREAQLPRGTLYRLLKKHDLDAAEFRLEGARFEI